MNNKFDFFTGLGIVILAVLVYYSSSQMPTDTAGLGAGGFPKFVAVCLGGFGTILSIKAFLQIKKGKKDVRKLDLKELAFSGLLVAAFALYIALVKPLGYILSTTIFLFVFMLIYGERIWLRMVVISVAFSLIVFYLFTEVFNIMLPHGSIF